jgi:hypothetical protein
MVTRRGSSSPTARIGASVVVRRLADWLAHKPLVGADAASDLWPAIKTSRLRRLKQAEVELHPEQSLAAFTSLLNRFLRSRTAMIFEVGRCLQPPRYGRRLVEDWKGWIMSKKVIPEQEIALYDAIGRAIAN